jgi:Cu(I)/Ag(I) efflux system membrane fusion protein
MIKISGARSLRHRRPQYLAAILRPRPRRSVPVLLLALVLLGAAASGDGSLSLVSTLQLVAPAAAAEGTVKQKYTCPMHPHYISDTPGTCPICGMELVPAKGSDEAAAPAGDGGRAAVTIAPETIQTMGVRTAKVETAHFGREVRAYGIVKENERLQQVINNRLDGWIEDLSVKAVGDPVRRGDLLYRVYSPELFVSQRDYLSTLGGNDRARQKAANLRLRSYGVQPRAIHQLEQQREAMMQVPFYAETDGVIAKIEVQSGSFVARGGTIAMIQDYSTVWLVVSVAEQDMGFIARDSVARVVFPTLQSRETTARVDYVYPTIDSKSRTGQVRLVIDNHDGRLRPGTYADVMFEVDGKDRLAVPSEALLMDNEGSHVVLAEGGGRFRPQAVKTGLVAGDRTEIVSGLRADDVVVTSGQFLIDSESALRESFSKMQRVDTPLALIEVGGSELAMIDHLVDAALYLHEAEVDGYGVDAAQLAPARAAAAALQARYGQTRLAPVLAGADAALAKAQAARSAGQRLAALDDLVGALEPWLVTGRPQHYAAKQLALYRDAASRRLWLQQGGKPDNPYGKGDAEVIDLAVPAATPQAGMAEGGAHVH